MPQKPNGPQKWKIILNFCARVLNKGGYYGVLPHIYCFLKELKEQVESCESLFCYLKFCVQQVTLIRFFTLNLRPCVFVAIVMQPSSVFSSIVALTPPPSE